MIVCSAESIMLSLSKNRLAKNFTILLFYIVCRWIETAKTSPSYFWVAESYALCWVY